MPPLSICLVPWLRGLDMLQRPLGYEYKTAMTGDPLILLLQSERDGFLLSRTFSDSTS